MNILKKWWFLVLIFVVIVSPLLYNLLGPLFVRGVIEGANYCEINSDCVKTVHNGAVGCNYFVNVAEEARVNEAVGSFDTLFYSVSSSCMTCLYARCEEGKCIPVCEGEVNSLDERACGDYQCQEWELIESHPFYCPGDCSEGLGGGLPTGPYKADKDMCGNITFSRNLADDFVSAMAIFREEQEEFFSSGCPGNPCKDITLAPREIQEITDIEENVLVIDMYLIHIKDATQGIPVAALSYAIDENGNLYNLDWCPD